LIDRALGIELERDIGAADQLIPAASRPATSSRRGSWPAQITTVSTSSTCGLPPMTTCRPVVDVHVFDAGEHRHAASAQQRVEDVQA
jgi:hypothetical protein